MYLEELIEVAIGLVLIFTVISVAVTGIQEWFAAWSKKRSKDLEATLRELLAESAKAKTTTPGDGTTEETTGMLGKIYSHPAIQSLRKGKGLPSYIPRDKFVLALFDTVVTAGTDGSTLQKALVKFMEYTPTLVPTAQKELNNKLEALAEEAKQAIKDPIQLAALRKKIERFSKDVADKYNVPNIGPTLESIIHSYAPVTEKEVLAALKRGAAMLTVENIQLREVLDDIVQQAEIYVGDGESVLTLARQNAEKWFDDMMDRASGWYKRYMQNLALAFGLFLALLFNVDSLEIATRLWLQPTLRQSLVQAAERYQLSIPQLGQTEQGNSNNQPSSPTVTLQRMQSELVGLSLPVGWKFEPVSSGEFTPGIDSCTPFPGLARPIEAGRIVYGVPINRTCKRLANAPQGWGYASKAAGIAITGLATMQGAPFWFDILKKLINVRSSGVKPEEKEGKK